MKHNLRPTFRNVQGVQAFLHSPLVGHPGEYFDTFPGWPLGKVFFDLEGLSG